MSQVLHPSVRSAEGTALRPGVPREGTAPCRVPGHPESPRCSRHQRRQRCPRSFGRPRGGGPRRARTPRRRLGAGAAGGKCVTGARGCPRESHGGGGGAACGPVRSRGRGGGRRGGRRAHNSPHRAAERHGTARLRSGRLTGPRQDGGPRGRQHRSVPRRSPPTPGTTVRAPAPAAVPQHRSGSGGSAPGPRRGAAR